MNKVKIGLISYAHERAESYLHQLLKIPEAEVIGVADEQIERVEPLLKKYPIPHYDNVQKLLAADVHAVIICAENANHKRITVEAAKSGKHVLCETPLGLSVDDMQEMIDICKENDVQLMTAFPYRFIPAVLQAKAALDRGDIGKIIAIKATNRGTMPGSWIIDQQLSGGGAILDQTVHLLDLMIWFLKSRVVEVYAEVDTLFHEIEIDDAGMVHARFENGVQAVIDPSWSRGSSFPYREDVTMDIIGAEGVLSIDAFAQKNDLYSDDTMKTEWHYWGDDMDEWLIKDFVRSIKDQKNVSITGEDGLKSAAVVLAAYESAKRGEPVMLSADDWNVEG